MRDGLRTSGPRAARTETKLIRRCTRAVAARHSPDYNGEAGAHRSGDFKARFTDL